MSTQDEVKNEAMPDGVDAKVMEEYDHWCRIERIILSVCLGMVFIICLLIASRISDGNFSNVPWGMFICTTMTAIVFLANFKPSKPVRIVREAIWLVTLLLVAFGALCWVGCLFGNGSRPFREVVGEFKCCGICILGVVVYAVGGYFALKRKRELARKEATYREKVMRCLQNGLGARKVDEFLRKHPSLVVSNMKEFAFLVIRYMIWGEILYLLAYEAYVLVRHCIF